MIKTIKKKTYNFLIWTQKWTKTDMIYIAKEGFWIVLGQNLSTLLGLLSVIVFGNIISEELYGTYKFILSIITILGISTLHGMQSAITKASAQNFDKDFITGLKTRIKWGLIGAFASISLGIYYFSKENNFLGLTFIVFSIFIPFMDSFNLYTSFLNGKKKFKKSSKYSIISKSITTFAVITTILLTKNIYITLFICLLFTTFSRLFCTILAMKQIDQNSLENHENIKFGKNLSFFNILGKITTNIDNILIFHYLGAKEVAIYAMALLPVRQISGPLGIMNTLSLPKLSEKTPQEIKKSLPPKLIKFFFLLCLCSLFYIIVSPYAYSLILPKYISSINYSRLFSLSFLFVPAGILEQTLISQMKKKQLYTLKIVLPLFKLTLFMLLLPIYGIGGAITTLLLTMLANLLILIFFFRKL